jgi:hypothetical protein
MPTAISRRSRLKNVRLEAMERCMSLTQHTDDRMLLFFWLPILMSAYSLTPSLKTSADSLVAVSLMWAAHSGLRMAFNTLRTAIPLKTGLRN